MPSSSEDYDRYVPENLLREVSEYEESLRKARPRAKRRFPSNEDIVRAILEVTGGTLTRHNIDSLYESVIEHLRSQGFDTAAVTGSRVERLVMSLIRRGSMSERLSR